MVKIEIVTRVWVQVGLKFGILPDSLRRLLKDASTLSIADDVVRLSSDGLYHVSLRVFCQETGYLRGQLQ